MKIIQLNKHIMKRILSYKTALIFIILLFFYCEAYAGREKIVQIAEKYGAKYIDDFFHYVGLMGLLAFMKAVSWSKMLFGGFLSIVGAFYPSKKERSEGEAHIEVSKFKIFIRGSIKFALVIVGAILIIGSIIDGYKDKEKYYPLGYIGVSYVKCDAGALIMRVGEGSSAYSAGIRPNDKIVKIDGIPIEDKSLEEISNFIQGKAHSYVQLEVLRDSVHYVYVLERKKYSWK